VEVGTVEDNPLTGSASATVRKDNEVGVTIELMAPGDGGAPDQLALPD
jgi:hypothetical protein